MMVCKNSDLLYEELEKSEDFDREKSYDETIEEC